MSSRSTAREQRLWEECGREKGCNDAVKVGRSNIGNEPWEELWARQMLVVATASRLLLTEKRLSKSKEYMSPENPQTQGQ